MPVIYKAQKSTLATKEGKKLFYPRVITTGNVGTNQLAREIAELSSLTTGDVKNTIDNLVIVIARHLQASEIVTIDGLGSFRFTLTTSGNGVELEEDVTAAQSVLRVRFLPATTRRTDGSVATRSLVDGARCVRFDKVQADAGQAGTGTEPETPGGGSGEDDDFQLG